MIMLSYHCVITFDVGLAHDRQQAIELVLLVEYINKNVAFIINK